MATKHNGEENPRKKKERIRLVADRHRERKNGATPTRKTNKAKNTEMERQVQRTRRRQCRSETLRS